MSAVLLEAPPAIIDAILRVQGAVGQLGKEEFNPHGKYKFVSIDAYYAKVARVATQHGLSWICRCLGSTLFFEKAIRFDYTFDLMHSSGATVKDAFTHPIIHPLQGAQTAGSALSYADKLFMRHVFHVVTGEQDADAVAPIDFDEPGTTRLPAPANDRSWVNAANAAQAETGRRHGEATPPANTELDRSIADNAELMADVRKVAAGLRDGKPVLHVPEPGADLDLIEQVFVRFVDLCETRDELIDFWEMNIPALDVLQQSAPDRHAVVRARFVARKAVIEKKG